MARTFPQVRAAGHFLVVDEAIAGSVYTPGRGHALGMIHGAEARAFVIEACNAHSSLAAEHVRLAKAKADLAEADLAEKRRETPAPLPPAPEYGWYAGLSLTKLSVGPLPTSDAAIDAARREHGDRATLFVVEAKTIEPIVEPFDAGSVNRVFDRIDADNAFPFGADAVLPPLRAHHEDDLAKRLNAAVADWMAAHGIKLIGNKLGDTRKAMAVVPHEVNSVSVAEVPDWLKPRLGAGSTAKMKVFVDEIDRWPAGGPLKSVTFDDDPKAWDAALGEGWQERLAASARPDTLAAVETAVDSFLSDVRAQVRVLDVERTTFEFRPGSKATQPGGCGDCGPNYCHCLVDVRVKP